MNLNQGAIANYLVQQAQFPIVRKDPRGQTPFDELEQSAPRKLPQSAGTTTFNDEASTSYARGLINREVDELKKTYGLPADDTVVKFLMKNQSIRAALQQAICPLRDYFGREAIFNLEISSEEDGDQMLYAIAVWHGPVRAAADALRAFQENWWLDHMTPATADLAFIYEIA